MNEYNLVPNIRFKGFDDKWSEKKLDNAVAVIMGQAPSSSNYHDHQVNHSMILIQGNADIENNKIKPRLWTTQITKETIPNDIILTVRAPVGEVAKNDFDAVIGRGVAALRGNRFLYYYLENINQIGYWNRISTGSTFMSISSDDIKEVKISLPRCKEQKYIYTFFTKLDKLLDMQQQKIDKLELLKKALLQKLFPKSDSKTPELRFKGYEEDWSVKKLGEITKYVKGYAFQSQSYTKHGVRIIRATDISNHNIQKEKNSSIFLSKDMAKSYLKYIIHKKDIIITTVGVNMGNAIYVYEEQYSLLNQNLVKISTIDGFDSLFVYFQLKQPHYLNYISRIERGNAQTSIAINDLWNYSFKVPKIGEQQKIGNLLSKVDQLIELENKKLQNFQQVKKCLLQNMFVE